MKIYSKFKDYYDIGLQFGIDDNIVYERKTEFHGIYPDIPLLSFFPQLTFFHLKTNQRSYDAISLKDGIVTFSPINLYLTGKRYFGLRAFISNTSFNTVFWNFDSFEKFVYNCGWKLEGKSIYDIKGLATLKESFENSNVSLDNLDYLIVNKIVSIVLKPKENFHHEWEINPRLHDLEFYKVIDAWSAFQEISMWIGGVLSTHREPPVALTEAERLQKHGMDKWSFRKKVR